MAKSAAAKKPEPKVERVRARSRREMKSRSGLGKAWDFHLPKALRSERGMRRLREEAELETAKRASSRDAHVVTSSEMVH